MGSSLYLMKRRNSSHKKLPNRKLPIEDEISFVLGVEYPTRAFISMDVRNIQMGHKIYIFIRIILSMNF